MGPRVQTVDVGDSTLAYYSPATVTDSKDIVHVSGQLATVESGNIPSDYASQIHLALLNLRQVIAAAGASVHDILKLNVFIVNYNPRKRKHIAPIQKFLGTHRPAMTLVPVPQLAVPGALFEIDAVVARGATGGVSSMPKQIPYLSAQSVDVVVIGAGLAGLSAARKIIDAGYSCVILEARDRVGGRTFSKSTSGDGGVVDLGAAWINDTNQSCVYALAREFGAELIVQNTEGKVVLQEESGKLRPFRYGELPSFDEKTKQHLADIRDKVEADCQKVDCARPSDARVDAMTFEAYLKSIGASHEALQTATVWTRAMLGQEPSDISALYFLNYCKSGGGLLQMRSDQKDGGQYLRVRQGTQLFAKGLASCLPQDALKLSSPVTAIHRNSSQDVIVKSSSGTYRARKVISAMPMTVLKTIDIKPELPLSKQVLTDSFSYGYYSKAMLVFKTPFWANKGFCGLAQSFKGPAAVIRDTSVPVDDKHVLTCFMAGTPGRAWSVLSKSERIDMLLEQTGELFGDKQQVRAEFEEMVHFEWSKEPFAGLGCPCPSLPPGVLTVVGTALREPHGDIHFVGTETAEEWKGYMEGAVRSGYRGADAVRTELQKFVSKI